MSHFTKIATQVTDLECLKQALDDLGYGFTASKGEVKGHGKQRRQADLVVKLPSTQYNIGFAKTSEGAYDLVADWWGVENETNVRQEPFVQQLKRKYAYHKVKSELKVRGLTIAEEQVEADQSVKLLVRSWA